MRPVFLTILALGLLGCVNEHAFEVDIVAGDPVPPEVVSWELRLTQLEPTEECPTAEMSASAARYARLLHVQTFTGVGMAIGEIPAGRWAVAVLARDATCGVQLYGCTEANIAPETFSPIVITVRSASITELCGDCRTCESGGCSPDLSTCD